MFTPVGKAVSRLGIRPNHITAMQFPMAVLTCYYLLQGNIAAGTLFIVFTMIFDGLDGLVARVNGQETRFGHYFDKVADLFGIMLLLIGVAAYSPVTMKLCIALCIINALLYITNEIKEPFFYSATRTTGLLGLMMLIAAGSLTPLNFWLTVSICIGGFLLLRKIWMIITNFKTPPGRGGRPRVFDSLRSSKP